MTQSSRATVPVHGSRTATGPLTWGQQAIWAAILRTRPEDHYFNYARDHVLPPGLDTDAVLAALAALLARHEALRTRLLTLAEEPEQQVRAEGRFEVELRDCAEEEAEQVARSAAAAMTARTFDYVAEWPLRVLLVRVDGRPRRAVLGFCHLAADGGAADVVLRDLDRLLADPAALPEPAPQPLDLALRQAGAEGAARNAAAVDWWDAEYRRIPPSMFRTKVAPPAEPRFWTGRITSPALGPATAQLARSSRTGATAVLMAACTGLVAEFTGEDLCALLPIVGNRFQAERRDLVSTLALEGLVVVPVDRAATFTEQVRTTWAASLKGYQHAEYDDRARDAMAAKVAADRGETVHPYCCFNDLRDTGAPGRPGAAARRGPVALPEGPVVFDWPRKPEKVACRFCVHVVGGPEDFTVELTADTCYLPPADIERFLRALESRIVDNARRSLL